MTIPSGARYAIGGVHFAVVNDGTHWYDAGAIFGVVPRIMWERQQRELDDRYRMPTGLNCLLLRSQGKTVLIETGVGGKPGDREAAGSPAENGTLMTSLAALDVSPEEIDVVVNTHLHSDHCGWNTSVAPGADPDAPESLIPTFPNASYYVSRAEWEDATHPNERTRATYLAKNLDPVADRLELVDAERETAITDEIVFLPTPGHTHGHGSVVVRSGREWGVYVGDLVQHRSQLERTAWVSGLDVLPLVSMETKKQLVERCIEEQALVMFCHGPYPGVGRMTRTAEGHRKWVDVQPVGEGLPHPHEA
jgi:glyoxylase-like metal-dependent hydrolase (beta-lactamase superfamily II)